MKKTIILVLLIALLCALICGCTPPDPENVQTGQNGTLPQVQTDEGKTTGAVDPSEQAALTDPANSDRGESGAETQNVEPVNPMNPGEVSEDPTVTFASEYDDDPEMATASDYVIDGGDEFVIGGN